MEGDCIISIKGAEEKATNKPLQRHGDTKEDATISTSSKESKADNEAPQTQGDTKVDEIITPFIKELIENTKEKTSKGNCDSSKMHRVPPMLRNTTASRDEKIFEPKVVSIGPYHNGTSLREVQKLKPKIAEQFHQKYEAAHLVKFFKEFKDNKDIEDLDFKKLYGKDMIERFGVEKFIEMMRQFKDNKDIEDHDFEKLYGKDMKEPFDVKKLTEMMRKFKDNKDIKAHDVEKLNDKDMIKQFGVEKLIEMMCKFKDNNDIEAHDFDKRNGKDIIECIGVEKLREMMFLDGCFILGFIKCITKNQIHNLGMKNNQIHSVQQDLFLLENQLPCQVLQVLIESMKNNESRYDLEDAVAEFINWNNNFTYNLYRSLHADIKSSDHLLDIQYKSLLDKHSRHIHFCLPWSSKASDRIHLFLRKHSRHIRSFLPWSSKASNRIHLFRGVKELTEAGIKLRPSRTGSIKDVHFSTNGICGTLTLPHMTIDNSTKSVFFNLIAYEECTAKPNEFWFTSYISFLDLLIDHTEDVKELRTAGIVDNRLGSDDQAARLFNEMVVNLGPGSDDTYHLIKKQIRVHFNFRRKIWMVVWLFDGLCNHFNNSWAIFAFFGAFIVASLAAIQTYVTVRPLF